MKYDVIFGIDPDVDKSGLAVLRFGPNGFYTASLLNLDVPQLIQYVAAEVMAVLQNKMTYTIQVEAGWFNKSHWHLSLKDSKASAAAKGNSVGRNHELGRTIVKFLRMAEANVEEVKPLPTMWKGPGGKITHEEIKKFVHGIPGHTNQEQRDALMLCWIKAGMPIRK